MTDLVACQICIFHDSHDRGKGHGSFVQCLNQVCHHHNHQDALVNHPPQPLVRRFVNVNSCIGSIFGDFFIHLPVVGMILLWAFVMKAVSFLELLSVIFVRIRHGADLVNFCNT